MRIAFTGFINTVLAHNINSCVIHMFVDLNFGMILKSGFLMCLLFCKACTRTNMASQSAWIQHSWMQCDAMGMTHDLTLNDLSIYIYVFVAVLCVVASVVFIPRLVLRFTAQLCLAFIFSSVHHYFATAVL